MSLVSASPLRSAARCTRARVSLAWTLALASSLSCGPSPSAPLPPQSNQCASDPAPANGLATVQLGRDARDATGAFDPLRDGDAMPIVHGAQGGQHFYVSVRLYSPTTESWAYTFTLTSPGGQTLASTKVALSACGPGWTLSEKIRVVLFTSSPAAGTLMLSAAPVDGATPADGGAPLTESVSISAQ
jgi:hypothetical protein